MTSSIRSIRTFIAALCALTMVAWLALPAMADEGDRGNRPDHAGEQGSPDHAGEPGEPEHAQGSKNRSEQAEKSHGDDSGERRDGGVQAQSASQDAPHGHAHGHDNEPPAHGQNGAPPEHAQGDGEGRNAAGQDNDNNGDPNRGTVKIRDNGYDGSPRNEPHVTCEFTIAFLGFDEDTDRAFTIHVHPPTAENGPGETVAYSGSVDLTQAEQGNDLSAEYGPVHVDDLDGLTEANRHDQQGWHLKITVDGPKHKVFWIDCPVEGDTLPGELENGEPENGEPENGETENGEPDNGLDAAFDVDADAIIAAPVDGDVVAAVDADGDVAVLAGAIEADDDAAVAAPDQLPVTGGNIALIALLGLLLTGLGTAALRLNYGGESVSG